LSSSCITKHKAEFKQLSNQDIRSAAYISASQSEKEIASKASYLHVSFTPKSSYTGLLFLLAETQRKMQT
jgi:hypothetical protein